MRSFKECDIYERMNKGNTISKRLIISMQSVNSKYILNNKMDDILSTLAKTYKDTVTIKAIEAIKQNRIFIVALPLDKVFPANIPFVRVKRNGSAVVIVDITPYATLEKVGDSDTIASVKIDIVKLYSILIPAFIALEVINEETSMSSDVMKDLSYLWAKMFNQILMSQRVFVGNRERYQAYMYYAIRFFLSYYIQAPAPIVEKISRGYIGDVDSSYILMIEDAIKRKQVDIYSSWEAFASTMFSNEITNIRAATNIEMNIEQYIRVFTTNLGKGSYLALWSADYAFYCFFCTWEQSYILSNRAFSPIVDADPKLMPRLLRSLYQEI